VENQPPQRHPEQSQEQPNEASTPPSGRRFGTADLAFLARIPTHKPETFDRDAIRRALWMVGGLALGLWIITLIARPQPPLEPEPEALMQEVPPIVLPGNAPAPPAISLTPAPAWTAPPPAPGPNHAEQGFADPNLNERRHTPITRPQLTPAEAENVAMPAAADTPDPSNLFPSE
jgi:hypothetical protein